MSKSIKTVIPAKAGIQKAKDLAPRLRFPEFRDTEQWRETQLGELGEFTGGGTPSKSNDSFWKGSIPWVSSSDISEDSIHEIRISRFITEDALKSSATKLVPEGSILLVSRVGVGKLAITKSAVCTSQDFTNLTPCDDNLEFLGYLLKANAHALEGLGQGMAIKGFTKEDITKLTVYLPELEEQQKIADCLSSLDALIAAQADKIDVLKTHKKGLMQQLFPREGETVPRLRFAEFRDAGEWEPREVGKVFNVTRGNVLSMTLVNEAKTEETPYPVYSSQTKRNGLCGYYGEYLYKDAITWTTDGANAGDVNFREGEFYCTNVCGVLINEDGHANPCTAEIINSVAKRHVSYVGNPKLMNGVMSRIVVPFPSIGEQQKIADFLWSLDALIAAHTEKLDALKAHKKGLMQQLFPSHEAVGV